MLTERESVSVHFGLLWVRPWDNRGKCYMNGKMIQCWSKIAACTYLSSTVYELQRDIGRKLQPLAFNSKEKFGRQKTRIMGLPGSEDSSNPFQTVAYRSQITKRSFYKIRWKIVDG